MTLRGLRLLTEAEVILVEEFKTGKKILDQLKIDIADKEIIPLNEHNEKLQAKTILEGLLMKREKVCLICDCGHPAIADSGQIFLKNCLEYGLEVKYVPGGSAILGALLVSGFPSENFYYRGFLPRSKEGRNQALNALKGMRSTIIIMETAYRLGVLLEAVKKKFSRRTRICLAFNLTFPK